MKKKLKKSIQAIIFGLVIGIQSFVMPLHAEGITTPSVQPDFTQVPDDTFFSDVDFKAVAKDLTKALVVFGDTLTGSTNPYEFTWNGFKNYLEYKESLVLEQHPTIGVRQKLDGGYEYDIPQDLKQEIVNFVNVEVKGNPLSYQTCSVSSYKFMSPNQFNSYNLYASLQNFIKSQNGYTFISGNISYGQFNGQGWIYVIPRTVNHGFYGTTTLGSFTNVQNVVNWQGGEVWNYSNEVKRYSYVADGTITEWKSGDYWYGSTPVRNTSSITLMSTSGYTVFSNMPQNEYVYVFDNINAYKNYNSGMPQNYYFTSEGLQDNWSAPTGTINSNNVDNSYRYYNNVVSNVQSGWTADEVLALVDKISANQSSSGSNSDSNDDDDDDDDNWLDGLFSGIVGTIKGIITEISDGIVGIIHMVFGYDDEEGVHHDGVLTNIITMLSGGFTGFLSDIFSFLPSEFVALFTAFLTLSILFGVIKLIRGA